MNAQSGAEKNRDGSRKKNKHLSGDESVDEDTNLIEAEPVEVKAEISAEENEPIEGTMQDDKLHPPAFWRSREKRPIIGSEKTSLDAARPSAPHRTASCAPGPGKWGPGDRQENSWSRSRASS
jgi:hypothetical protein